MKRVGLLTLPFHVNYGGIIQAAALYRFLEDNGFDPVVLKRKPATTVVRSTVGTILKSIPGQNIRNVRSNERRRATHYPFMHAFMPQSTPFLRSGEQLRRAVSSYQLDAVIVGSDQVWRPDYHGDDEPLAYFLDFVDPSLADRISYAASFGSSVWRADDSLADVPKLLSGFKAVSVRERSGLDICRNDLGVDDCALVIDPTLLVDPAFYADVLANLAEPPAGHIMEYVLDCSATVESIKESAIALLARGDQVISIRPEQDDRPPDIATWLSKIKNANFVITDSFHGTIFCILFERDFITVVNKDRGTDRFTTLLNHLGLGDRLFDSVEQERIADVVRTPIDYERVRTSIEDLRERSAKFLVTALGSGDDDGAPAADDHTPAEVATA